MGLMNDAVGSFSGTKEFVLGREISSRFSPPFARQRAVVDEATCSLPPFVLSLPAISLIRKTREGVFEEFQRSNLIVESEGARVVDIHGFVGPNFLEMADKFSVCCVALDWIQSNHDIRSSSVLHSRKVKLLIRQMLSLRVLLKQLVVVLSRKYVDLMKNLLTNYAFSFDPMLNDKSFVGYVLFEQGNTTVYHLYAHARICSMI